MSADSKKELYIVGLGPGARQKMTQEAIDDRKANAASGASAIGKISILLTGDVEGEGERQLTQELQEQRGQRENKKNILR